MLSKRTTTIHKFPILFMLLTPLILNSCNTFLRSNQTTPSADSQEAQVIERAEESQWQLISMVNDKGAIRDIPSDILITLQFTNGEISGVSGCNQYFATYLVENGQIAIGQIAKTEKFCNEPTNIMQMENNYLQQLQKVAFLVEEEGIMLAQNIKKETLLIFRSVTP